MADTYTTEAIACGLSDVAGWLENEGGRDKHARTIRLGVERLRELGAASGGEGELDWLLKQVVELCEHTEDEMYEALEKGPTNEHEIGFYKGRKWEAKGIRRAIAEVVRLRKSELRSFADAAAPSHPGEADRVGLGGLERLKEAASQGEWSVERMDNHGTSPADQFFSYGIECGQHTILDTLNSSGGMLEQEHDEDLTTVWDEQARRDLTYIAALVNAHRAGHLVPASLAALGTGEGSGGASPAGSGSHPSDHAPTDHGRPGFDPSRTTALADCEQRITRLHEARQSALRQMNEQSARAEVAEQRCIQLERGVIHPALAIDVQEHRDQAYQAGWADGYAEGFAKASAGRQP